MAYPGIGFAIIIGVALGSAIYYFLKGENQRNYYNAYQRSVEYTNTVPAPSLSTRSSPFRRTNNRTYRRRKNPEQCVICLEALTQNITSLKCNHKFHSNCINTWFQQSNSTRCPLCSKTNDPECIICYEPMQDNKQRLRCGHTFHRYCIQKWYKESRTCPLRCPL